MARKVVAAGRCSIRLACQTFSISETCYRYQAKLKHKNAVIADWLVRLTHNQLNWGFGLCYLYLRNVQGFRWNHKRVYRIYRSLELNLRIKPKKRLIRGEARTACRPKDRKPELVNGLNARSVSRQPNLSPIQRYR